jgi:hypothetical protein
MLGQKFVFITGRSLSVNIVNTAGLTPSGHVSVPVNTACMNVLPNTALEPTAATPAVGSHTQIHACDYSRRGSALDR